MLFDFLAQGYTDMKENKKSSYRDTPQLRSNIIIASAVKCKNDGCKSCAGYPTLREIVSWLKSMVCCFQQQVIFDCDTYLGVFLNIHTMINATVKETTFEYGSSSQ